jgi:organic radical activating enzyme
MKVFDFSKTPISQFALSGVMENELLFIGLPAKPNMKELARFTKKAQEFTRRLHLSAARISDVEGLLKLPLLGTIGVPLSASTAFEAYSRLRKLPQSQGLIPEFEVEGDLTPLGPALVEMIETFQIKRAYLRVSGFPQAEVTRGIRSVFEYLRLKGIFELQLYPTFLNPYYAEWNARTFNTYAGLRQVDIDLSNKCTHSCVFCGLWSNDAIAQIKKSGGGKVNKTYQDFMNKQIPLEKVTQIFESLPDTVEQIDFGGAGDPLTHPHWLEIIEMAWKRGFNITVYSNFEYPSRQQLDRLLELAERSTSHLHVILNISAASPQMYVKVRPRQNEKIFHKVVENIKYVRQTKRPNFSVTLLYVMNRENFLEAKEMVQFTAQMGWPMWFKPIELHGEVHQKYLIPKENMKEYAGYLQEALNEADRLKVQIYDRLTVEQMTAQYL